MILIYSNQCKHCNILLETISKHDKNNIVKIISVETLRLSNYNIDQLVHSVPALIILKENKIVNDEILYGKQVFDHLLLPNRGALFTQDNNTRLNKETKDSHENTVFDDDNEENGPLAFSLGSSMSDKFSSLDDNSDNLLKDKNYSWDLLSNSEDNIESNELDYGSSALNPISSFNDKNDKKLPSLEELMLKRKQDVI
jgi:hypothetical protein